MNYQKNIFTNIPVEFCIPKRHKIVFVADFFSSDVRGGAELTSDVLIAALNRPVFKVHSSSITKDLVESNLDKTWIFGNYTKMSDEAISYFINNKVEYYIIEYDFKYCRYRAPKAHLLATNQPCDCMQNNHGKEIEAFCLGAKKMFWMSEGQKNHFLTKVPSLASKENIIQLSAFDDETFDLIRKIRKPKQNRKKSTGILSGGSWIKGIPETIRKLNENHIPYEQIPNVDHHNFLRILSEYESFTFEPADFDTCPRVVIEAALLGLDLNLNENVLIKHDEWFEKKTPEEIESYLKMKRDSFSKNFNF